MTRLKEDGSIAIHLGAMSGKITYPYLFYERLKRWKNKELLQKIEKDPLSEFGSKK